MALTRRGKQAVGAIAVLAVVAGGAFALTGSAPAPIRRAVDAVAGVVDPPATCPLTGTRVPQDGQAPDRPLLAVKVENTEDAYPLAGLDRADMVYEEVVEGGITRFVALYHCRDAGRVGPVRSARTTDPKILMPFQQQPLLGYSGAAGKVVRALHDAGIVELTESTASAAFVRDGDRVAPHDLFTSTGPLWKAGAQAVDDPATPRPAFRFDEELPDRSRKAGSVAITFSSLSATAWSWDGDGWVRHLDGSPMELEGGAEVRADNVVIQFVKVTQDTIVDASGAPSPLVEMVGSGKGWVLRDGRAIAARWERGGDDDLTVFRTRDGDEIALAPGVTWVELVPTDGTVAIER